MNKRLLRSIILLLILPSAILAISGGDGPVWRPVTPEELQMKEAKVEPGADAEAIFWEVRLDDKKAGKLSYEHYVRVKIFTEKGRERYSKFDIAFDKGDKVEDVAARVIRPDGTIIELNPNDVFEQEILRADKIKVRAKSFAIPGIAPGVIVEYQYRQVLKNEDAGGQKLLFQRDIPIQQMAYFIRPSKGANLSALYYNMPDTRFVPDDDGFYVARMSNIPAFHIEPHMPPADQVRRWILLKYRSFDYTSMVMNVGMQAYLKKVFKDSEEVKQKALQVTAGAATDEERLRRIYTFVQTQIKNLSFDPALTAEEVEKKKIDDPEDVLKHGSGSFFMIDILFAALAHEAGFDARFAMTGDRSRILYEPGAKPPLSELHFAGIGVMVQGGLKFFDPGIPFLPYGRLYWNEEGAPAYLIGESNSIWTQTPLCPYQESVARRSAKFTLSEDGTLEGMVTFQYDGQQAIDRRREGRKDTQAEREETVKDQIKKLTSTAEVSAISVENFDDGGKPLTYKARVRIPNYAQKTGKRLFFQPSFFEYGTVPVFTETERKFSIWFSYPWSELDDVEVTLPKGYALDNADTPAEITDSSKVSSLKIKMGFDPSKNTLIMRRNFYFGDGGLYLFPVNVYPALKQLFAAFQTADSHIITLKQTVN